MAESTIMLTDSTMPQGKRVAVNAPVRDRHRNGRHAQEVTALTRDDRQHPARGRLLDSSGGSECGVWIAAIFESMNMRKGLTGAQWLLEIDLCAALQPRDDRVFRRKRRHAQNDWN